MTSQDPQAWLDALPPDRRAAIIAVRKTILDNLAEGFEEVFTGRGFSYQVPLSTYPETYNKKPLMYASLANQSRHMAVYLMALYTVPGAAEAFEAAYRATGKRCDIGKSCVRFKKLNQLPLDLIGESIVSLDVPGYIEAHERARQS